MIRPRGSNQQRYVKEILGNDINFGIGPAGTGKTYLAVACAVDALEREQVAPHPAGAPSGGSRREARLPARRPGPEESTPTCARCTTPSTRCSASNTSPN